MYNKEMKKISLWEIYKIFFLIGFQLLGGGYVILPLLQKYVVEERQWITNEDLIDYFSISQCIPGIIAGNISIFTGYKVRKLLGAIVAILGIITPCFICILTIANCLTNLVENKFVQNAFWGIRISVIILILVTIKDMWKNSVNSIFSYILFAIVLSAFLFLPVSPAVIIVLAAITGLIYSEVRGNKNA